MPAPVVIEFVGRDGVTRTARVVAGSLDAVGDAAERTGDGMRDAGNHAKDAEGKFKQFNNTLEKLASAMVAVETAKKVMEFTDEGAQIAGVKDAYANLANSAGVDSQKLLTSLRAASKGYVDDTTLMLGANKALLNGGEDLANALPKLLQIAGASAKATGGDMSQLYSDLIEGITKAEPEILDNLGLTINLTQTYDDYAAKLGKTANELTQAEKSQALLNEVLVKGDGYIQKVGTSSIETGGAVQRLKTEFTNLKNEVQELSAMGLEDLLNGGRTVELSTRSQELTKGQDYSAYVAMLRMVGEEEEAVTRAQYEFEQSLIRSGVATTDAMQRGEGYTFVLSHLNEWLTDVTGGMGVTQQSFDAIAAATIRASEGGAKYQDALDQLNTMLENHQIGINDYYTNLVALADQADINTARNEAVGFSAEQVAAAFNIADQAAQSNADSLAWMSDETADATLKNIDKQIAAENAANADYLLANAADQVAEGSVTAGDAAAALVPILHMEKSKIEELINAYLALNKVKSNPMITALKIGGAVSDAGGAAATKKVEELERAARRPARRAGGGGRGGGKSEAVQAAEKEQRELEQVHKKIEKEETDFRKRVEDNQKKYLERVTAAWRKYYDDLEAKTKEFQSSQFDDKADFLTSLASMEQQDRAAAMAAYQQYWDESNRLAQSGEVAKADALRQAAQEEILANQQREAKIRELKNQIRDEANADLRADLEEQQRLLEEADRIADDQATSRLNKIRDSKDEIAAERDESLQDAKVDYDTASQELIENFKERNAEIATAYGDLASSHASTMDAIMAQAKAASDILAGLTGAVAQAQAAGQGIPTVAPESRAYGGVMHAAKPYLVGDAPGGRATPYSEVVVPGATSYAMARSELDTYLAPPTYGSGGGGGSTTIYQGGGVAINVNGQAANIRLSPAEERVIEGIARRVYAEQARSSLNTNRLGGR